MGAQPPRYRFALNPHRPLRFSACSDCGAKTKLRKLPLVIHVDGFGLVTLGKTCRLCVSCEILVAHQDEIDPLIQNLVGVTRPLPDYLVLGTADRTFWRRGLRGPQPLAELIQNMADFKEHLRLEYTPGGWFPADQRR